MKFLDANIFLRHLVPGDEAKAGACSNLFRGLAEGDDEATTSEAIVAEIAFVLEAKAHHGLDAAEINARMQPILSLRGLRLEHKETVQRAFEVWASYPSVGFEDALSVAHMERQGITEIVSYDRDFDRLPDVTRIEP